MGRKKKDPDPRPYVPPSGHVAAAYARTDKERALWFSPAGMVRGRLDVQGVRKVYNEGMRETLASIQINPMRVVPNSGVKIWGDSTAQTRASALSNVNVRRLMCYLEKSLSIALLYNVFDPNDNVLRAQIRSICDDFLRPLLYNRALKYGWRCLPRESSTRAG
jgi:phage tail sheath protein FI